MKNKCFWLMMIIVLVVVLSGCTQSQTPPDPTSTPVVSQAEVSPTSEPDEALESLLSAPLILGPVVTGYHPGMGEDAALSGEIQVSFDQNMDSSTTAEALQVVGPDGETVQGSITWTDQGKTLRFKPDQPLEPASNYKVTVGQEASSEDGLSLEEAFTFHVHTITPLQVGQVFPLDGADQVQPTSQITVIFNRPVVALGISEEQPDLVQPLEIEPPTPGKGEWVNTSVYVFQPDVPLLSGTRYTVSIPAGLNDALASPDSALSETYRWEFTTLAPSVAEVQIGQDTITLEQPYFPGNVSLLPEIRTTFRQPMKRDSMPGALSLMAPDGQPIPLRFKWSADNQILTLVPLRYLQMGNSYTFSISRQAEASDGGKLAADVSLSFNTIYPPAILFAGPNNQSFTAGSQDFQIQFASPMEIDTIPNRVIFSPPVKGLSWYYDEWQNTMNFYGLEPSTQYQVSLRAGMRDIYGNAINQGSVVTFATAAVQPWIYLDMPYQALYRQDGPQEFYFSYTNIGSAQFTLYRISTEAFISFVQQNVNYSIYNPPEMDIVWQYEELSEAPLNETVQKSMPLTGKDGGPLPGGVYFLTMDTPDVVYEGKGKFLDGRPLMVATDNLTFKTSHGDALLWLTNLTSGEPVGNAPVKVLDSVKQEVAGGKTDKDGLFLFELPEISEAQNPTLYAISEDQRHFAFASSSWSSGVSAWDFGIWDQYYSRPAEATAYVYTDRPLYRPDQPVYFKGIVRMENDLAYQLPPQRIKEVEVIISSYEEEIYKEKLPLSDYGSFDGKLVLDSGAALGAYSIQVRFPGSKTTIGAVNFTVAEYRKPEFIVDVSASPANVLVGERFNAAVSAQYYSGGALSGAEVGYSVYAEPYQFIPTGDLGNYSFYDDSERYNGAGVMPVEQAERQISEGSGVTDENGRLELSLPAGQSTSAASMRAGVEITVTDLAGSAVSGQAQIIAHRSTVYAGLRPAQYVGRAGEEQSFELVAVDWDSSPVAAQRLDVAVSEQQWYSVQEQDSRGTLRWVSSVRNIPVTSFSGIETDEEGRAMVSFVPEKGGVYRALVTAYDPAGNKTSATAYMWVSGNEYISWQQSNDRTFQLVVDRDSYQPGDQAEILIASPFQGSSYALVTVERGLIRHQEVLELIRNSTIYRLPVTSDMAPTVYVSVLVVKGVDETNPRPDFKMGMAAVNVSTEEQQLQVVVSPDRESAGPGEQVTYHIQVNRNDGEPVEAEVSLGLSDLSALVLSGPNTVPMLDYFYAQRGLGVRTAVPITNSVEDYNAKLEEQISDGKGGGSGGGKGEGYMGVPRVRQDFPDTAYWEAGVVTGADGKASVTAKLPDNLTTWRMDARAVTLDTRVGQTTTDLVSTKPLLVRPQTPRFFVAGDRAVIGTAVHNNTGQDLAVIVELDAEGLELVDSKAVREVEIPTGQQAYVSWNIAVLEDAERVDLVFSAQSDGYQDASRPTLGTLEGQGIPVYRYEAPETVGTSGELTAGGTRTEAIQLPAEMEVTQGNLEVLIEPSLAAGMRSGLTYLEQYPYECIEQTVSRFLPNVFTTRAMRAAGLADADLEAELKVQVNTALQRLYNTQNSDGGWGWWSGGESQRLTSAYVVLGLYEAQQADYEVNTEVLKRGLSYLRAQPRVMVEETTYADHGRNTLSFILYVLARTGSPEVSRTVTLYDDWQSLPLYARAYLAQTLYWIDPEDVRLKNLTGSLVDSANLSASGVHWEENEVDYWNWNSDTRTTAIVLAAMLELDPDNPLNASAVRWLMRNRVGGRWASTQETAWTLMALTDWMVRSGELEADYGYAVQLNDAKIGEGQASSATLEETQTLQVAVADMLSDRVNRLVIVRTEGPGSLYYSANLNVHLPVAEVGALDQGIIISRRYYTLEDSKTPITTARQGDLVRGRLTIVVPQSVHYLLVEDPLPAGLEAIDASLKTSPQGELPEVYDWAEMSRQGWGWWYFSHVELRDEKVVLSTDYLPAGTYVYTYLARASTLGTFQTIPPTAQEFYFPDVYGRGEGSLFEVTP